MWLGGGGLIGCLVSCREKSARLPNQSDLRCRTGKTYAKNRNRNSLALPRRYDSYEYLHITDR